MSVYLYYIPYTPQIPYAGLDAEYSMVETDWLWRLGLSLLTILSSVYSKKNSFWFDTCPATIQHLAWIIIGISNIHSSFRWTPMSHCIWTPLSHCTRTPLSHCTRTPVCSTHLSVQSALLNTWDSRNVWKRRPWCISAPSRSFCCYWTPTNWITGIFKAAM